MFRSMRTTLQTLSAWDVAESLGGSSMRMYATAAPPVPALKINQNMQLQRSPVPAVGSSEESSRPLVLLLPWLAAKQKHVSNFSRIYLDRGCDVLTVSIRAGQILLPKSGAQAVAQRVVDFLQLENNRQRPIFVHAFSVGGYLYSEILQKMIDAETTKGEITDRVIGQVYDSVVDLDKVAFGTSRALFKNRFIQKSVELSIEGYMNMTYRLATRHYERASKLFYHNPILSPTLFYYSFADPVGSAKAIENCVETLRRDMGHQNIKTKAFNRSQHVSHMHQHREEYMCTLLNFLRDIPFFEDRGVHVEESGQNVKAIKA
ncbi:transmembrane protein 53-A-like [Diadema setosum]|uniref:transmembrane protein 53-A-like n=1 Tax=Diadema setosum TaxID=31175 RepID=UPI003B3A00BF